MAIDVDFDDMFASSSDREEQAITKTSSSETVKEGSKPKAKKKKVNNALAESIDRINRKKRNRKIFNGENTLSIKVDTNNVEFIAHIKEELIEMGLDEESYNRSTLGRAFLHIIESEMNEGRLKMEDIVKAYIK